MTALQPVPTRVDEVIAALRPGTTVQVQFLGQPPATYRCVAIPGSEPSTMRIEAHPELLDRARSTIRGLEAELAQQHAAARRTSAELAQVRAQLDEALQRRRRAEFALTGLGGLIQDAAAICDAVTSNQLSGPPLRQLAARIRAAITPAQPAASRERR